MTDKSAFYWPLHNIWYSNQTFPNIVECPNDDSETKSRTNVWGEEANKSELNKYELRIHHKWKQKYDFPNSRLKPPHPLNDANTIACRITSYTFAHLRNITLNQCYTTEINLKENIIFVGGCRPGYRIRCHQCAVHILTDAMICECILFPCQPLVFSIYLFIYLFNVRSCYAIQFRDLHGSFVHFQFSAHFLCRLNQGKHFASVNRECIFSRVLCATIYLVPTH